MQWVQEIDWLSTLVLAMVCGGTTYTIAEWREHIAARAPLGWYAFGLALFAGAALIGGAAQNSGSIFSDEAAAWVQAVGSIAAIVAAIVIDQGAARRLEAQRKSEVEASDQARRQDRAARIEAVRNLIYALAGIESEAAAHDFGPNGMVFVLSEARHRTLRAAIAAVDYHMATPGLSPASLVSVMALAQATMKAYRDDRIRAQNPDALVRLDAMARADAGYIRQLLEEYHHGVL